MMNQLRRSTTNRMLGGVAGGIAETFNWDPTLVRIGFVLLTLGHGVGLLLYAALWIIMPKSDGTTVTPYTSSSTGAAAVSGFDRDRMLGFGAIALGTLILSSMFHITGPVIAVLLLAGGWYFLRHRQTA